MKNNNLIALHSQEGGGKDVTAKIIQMFTSGLDCKSIHEHIKFEYKIPYYSEYKIKKFATPLKQICAILTGTELEQWEDREFKNTLLDGWGRFQINMTPRQIMQDVGEAMRNINPNVFVDALFRDYKPQCLTNHHQFCGKLSMTNPDNSCSDEEAAECLPSWCLSDLRFDNERLAIQKRNGILVKIERDISKSSHHSENSLNHFKDWDYVLDNSKDIPHLINEVEKMLKHFEVV